MFTKTLLSLSLTFFYTDSCLGSVSLISANGRACRSTGISIPSARYRWWL